MIASRRSPGRTRELAVQRLREALLRQSPGLRIGADGYCVSAEDNLLPGLALTEIADEFASGAGSELLTKVRAPHSSSALAVNSFAALRRHNVRVPLAGHTVHVTGFEVKRPTGLANAQPPHLDVLCEATDSVVAIESKCLEPLTPKRARFSPRYRDVPTPGHRQSRWFAEMERIVAAPAQSYRHLDAAQLIKHAFGLAACADHRPITLLYLFWEPLDAPNWPVFARHRAELATFADRVAGDPLCFRAMSYLDLWADWTQSPDLALRVVAEPATERYAVALDCTPRPHPL